METIKIYDDKQNLNIMYKNDIPSFVASILGDETGQYIYDLQKEAKRNIARANTDCGVYENQLYCNTQTFNEIDDILETLLKDCEQKMSKRNVLETLEKVLNIIENRE